VSVAPSLTAAVAPSQHTSIAPSLPTCIDRAVLTYVSHAFLTPFDRAFPPAACIDRTFTTYIYRTFPACTSRLLRQGPRSLHLPMPSRIDCTCPCSWDDVFSRMARYGKRAPGPRPSTCRDTGDGQNVERSPSPDSRRPGSGRWGGMDGHGWAVGSFHSSHGVLSWAASKDTLTEFVSGRLIRPMSYHLLSRIVQSIHTICAQVPEDTEDCRGLYGIIPGWSGSCDIQAASGRHGFDGWVVLVSLRR
jgi:hypothetical protein